MFNLSENLHPSVSSFKKFAQSNPAIVQEVRSGKRTWQELYEDWHVLGEGHESWQEVTEGAPVVKATEESTEEKSDFLNQVLGYLKKMDMNQVQSQMNNLSSALATVQGLVGQFQSGSNKNSTGGSSREQSRPHPFSFRKD